MRSIIVGALVALSSSFALAPVAGASHYTLPTREAKQTYSALWHAVRRAHGARAPGRNIRRWGIKTATGTRPASAREVAGSIRRLRALRLPLLVSAPPPNPPSGVMTARAPAGGTLAAIRACESGGNYSTNTGNGFYGAYQFTQQTWASVGGAGNPAAASPAEQDKRAAMLYAQQGASPWPVCGR